MTPTPKAAAKRSTQDQFLQTLITKQVPVHIFLSNGIKLHGCIEACDQFVLYLKNQVTQMVYKHAILTVVPLQPIDIPKGPGAREAEPAADD